MAQQTRHFTQEYKDEIVRMVLDGPRPIVVLDTPRTGRPKAELTVASTRGRIGGRRPKLTADQAVLAQKLYDERGRASLVQP